MGTFQVYICKYLNISITNFHIKYVIQKKTFTSKGDADVPPPPVMLLRLLVLLYSQW